MTKARKEQVSLEDTPYYHCMARCVRHAYLCGDDHGSGKNFDHRKQWIVDKLKQLSSIYAIDICAYAIMSNHYHVVLHVDIEKVNKWSTEEVISRWQKLFSGNVLINRYMANEDLSKAEIEVVSSTVAEWRSRLSDISWFMRCLNEFIARQANKEDECKGRFWEGRFKSQALLDETALLSCMVYVDLNPIRAGISSSLQDSDFTSIQERLLVFAKKQNEANKRKPKQSSTIDQPEQLLGFYGSLINPSNVIGINFSLYDYFKLVDWTGRAIREDKCGYIPPEISPILQNLGVQEKNWIKSIKYFGSKYYHLAGAADKLRDLANRYKLSWFKGIGLSKQLYASKQFQANETRHIISETPSIYDTNPTFYEQQQQMDLFADIDTIQNPAKKVIKKVKQIVAKSLDVPVQEDLFGFEN